VERRLTLADRLAYAAIGAVFGVVVGALAGWLIGGYPMWRQDLGTLFTVSAGAVPIAALVCATVGFVLGPRVGDFVGELIAALFSMHLPGERERHLPVWLVMCFWIALALILWHWLT
jgi:hypothetical protein